MVKYAEAALFKYLGAYWLLGLGTLCVLSVIWFPRGLIGEAIHRLESWGRLVSIHSNRGQNQ